MRSPSKELKEKVSFSVVVCTKNRPNELRRCITSLLSQSYLPKEVIIVDDASIIPVSFKDFFRINSNYTHININNKEVINFTIVRNKETQGVAVSRNNGILQANCDIIAFLDDDSFAHKDWLKNLVKNYKNKNIVGVGGPIVEIGREYPVKNSTKKLAGIDKNGNVVSNITTTNIKDTRKLFKKKVKFFRGGNMSFRRNILCELAGFDKNFSGNAYREETDLCLRVSKKGKLIFEPKALTYHKTAMIGGNREIINFDANRFLYWYFRNTLLLFMKHFSIKNSLKKIYAQIKKQVKHIKRNQISSTRKFLVIKSKPRAFYSMLKGSAAGFVIGIKSIFNPTKDLAIEYPKYIKTVEVVVSRGRPLKIYQESPTLLELIKAGIKKIFIFH